MWNLVLTNLVLPLAVDTVKKYINSTESKKDDKVLEVVQAGATYLADKPNNNVPKTYADVLKSCQMTKIQE